MKNVAVPDRPRPGNLDATSDSPSGWPSDSLESWPKPRPRRFFCVSILAGTDIFRFFDKNGRLDSGQPELLPSISAQQVSTTGKPVGSADDQSSRHSQPPAIRSRLGRWRKWRRRPHNRHQPDLPGVLLRRETVQFHSAPIRGQVDQDPCGLIGECEVKPPAKSWGGMSTSRAHVLAVAAQRDEFNRTHGVETLDARFTGSTHTPPHPVEQDFSRSRHPKNPETTRISQNCRRRPGHCTGVPSAASCRASVNTVRQASCSASGSRNRRSSRETDARNGSIVHRRRA
jgi:hypothetical protein